MSEDDLTIRLLRQAESNLEAALTAMPNLVASAFMASDYRDISTALRMVRTVRSFAEDKREGKR